MSRMTDSSTLYTENIRWEPLEIEGSQGWAWIKTLAKDDQTGARTALLRFDPGFRQEKAVSAWPTDSYVLEGGMQCGDRQYQQGTYEYRPRGVEYGPISSPTGMTRILFTSDEKERSSKEPLFIQNVAETPWVPSYTNMAGQPRQLKKMRQDQEAGYSIFFHSMRVPGSGPREGMTHIHEHSEEVYVIEGELEQYCGEIDGHVLWRPGTYTCRPPGAGQHGGPTTATPCVVLIRLGYSGDLQTRYKAGQTHSPETTMVSGAFFVE